MRRKRGGRKRCIRLTSARQKGALMKFYDVALAQGVHDKVLTYNFFRFVSGALLRRLADPQRVRLCVHSFRLYKMG
jgi:hypothetical protein